MSKQSLKALALWGLVIGVPVLFYLVGASLTAALLSGAAIFLVSGNYSLTTRRNDGTNYTRTWNPWSWND